MIDPKAFGKVAVLMGGWSAEREISLRSGAAVLAGLRLAGVDAEPLDGSPAAVLGRLAAGGFGHVFNILHGRYGEDGVIQGALELMGLPYTGSGVLASALAMDKLRTKQLWLGAGLPTPPWVMLQEAADCQAAARQLGLPLMIKPALEGSSIGITKVEDEADLHAAFELARGYGPVLAERFIQGPEYTAAIVDETALPLIRLETDRRFYDYEAKYLADDTRYHCPCGLPVGEESELQTLALAAFRVLGGSGWGRVDLLVDDAGPWLIEANTIPGMTDHSLVPMAARAAGMDFPELVVRILATSTRPAPPPGRSGPAANATASPWRAEEGER